MKVIIVSMLLVCSAGFLFAQMIGDVNSDGSVNIIDSLLVAQYYVGLDPATFNPSYGDVNCDSHIDIIDALIIAQYYVGVLPALPCQATEEPTGESTPDPTEEPTQEPTPDPTVAPTPAPTVTPVIYTLAVTRGVFTCSGENPVNYVQISPEKDFYNPGETITLTAMSSYGCSDGSGHGYACSLPQFKDKDTGSVLSTNGKYTFAITGNTSIEVCYSCDGTGGAYTSCLWEPAPAITPVPTISPYDMDDDGMDDAWEDKNGLDRNIDDSLYDPDNDGLNNISEFKNSTLPKNDDSDSDGIIDGTEVLVYKTNPNAKETWDGGTVSARIHFTTGASRKIPAGTLSSDNSANIPRKLYAHFIKNITLGTYYIARIERLNPVKLLIIEDDEDIVQIYHAGMCQLVAADMILGLTLTFSDLGQMSMYTYNMTSSGIEGGILYAINHGYDVVSISRTTGARFDSTLSRAVNEYGITICCGTGNDDEQDLRYPADNPDTIAVGAVNYNILTDDWERWVVHIGRIDQIYEGSNYGKSSNYSGSGIDLVADSVDLTKLISGTSFATPRVAAVALCMLARNPNHDPASVREILRDTAKRISTDLYLYAHSKPSGWPEGWNKEVGYGMLDQVEAVDEVKE